MATKEQEKFNEELQSRTFERAKTLAASQHSAFWDDLPQLLHEVAKKHEKPLAPGTLAHRARLRGKVEVFTSNFIQLAGLEHDVQSFLAKDGYPLEVDTTYLKLLLRFLARRDVGAGLASPQKQHEMSYKDLSHLVTAGCFSGRYLFKNPDDRLQFVTYLTLLAYTGARAGELAVANMYKVTNDALKYKDLEFWIIRGPDGKQRIEVDITIRNLKGWRYDDSAYRGMTVQEDQTIPFATDAASLLAIMAVRDGAIQGIESTAAMSAIDPSAFDEYGEFRLSICPDKADMLVFRRIEWEEASQTWVKDDVKGQTADHFAYQLKHISRAVSLPGIRFKDIRRLACNTMVSCRIPDINVQASIGHVPGTGTLRRHYVSMRSQVNLQALVCHGRTESALAPLPQRRFPSTPYPELSAAESSFQDDARIGSARLIIAQATLVLRQRYGSVAAARELAKDTSDAALLEDLNTLTKAQSEVKGRLASLRHQARLEKGQNLNAKRYSDTFSASLTELQEDDNLDALEQLLPGSQEVATGSNSLAFWLQPQPESNDALPVAIKSSIAAILASFNSTSSQQGVYDRLFAAHSDPDMDEGRPSLSEAEKLLFQLPGTRSNPWRSCCPGCKGSPPGANRQAQWLHVVDCVSTAIKGQAAASFASLQQGSQCPWLECKANFASIFNCEINAQNQESLIPFTDIALHMERHLRRPRVTCPVKLPSGEFCPFLLPGRLIEELTTDSERAQLLAHFEAAHGWPVLNIEYCHEHQAWLVGTIAIEHHFAQDVTCLLESDIDSAHHCELCLHDETLRPSQRARRYDGPSALAYHVASCHVMPVRSKTITCGICSEEVADLDWPDHLISEHRIALCGSDAQQRLCAFRDSPAKLRCTDNSIRLAYLARLGHTNEEGTPIEGSSKMPLLRARNQQTLAERAQSLGLSLTASPAQQVEFLEKRKQEQGAKARAQADERSNAMQSRRAAAAEARAKQAVQKEEQAKARLEEARQNLEVRQARTAAQKRKEREEAISWAQESEQAGPPLNDKQALREKDRRKRLLRTPEQVEADKKKAKDRQKGPDDESRARNREAQARCRAKKSAEKKAEELAARREKKAAENTPERKAERNRLLCEQRAQRTPEQVAEDARKQRAYRAKKNDSPKDN